MEYLILGLLILSPMTGYELQQFIKNNLSLICSHSAGSLQTALNKLLKEGKISATEIIQGKRIKKQFSITPQGKEDFAQWVSQPMNISKSKNMELSRLFFMGLAKPEERIEAVKNYLSQIQETKNTLLVIRDNFRKIKETFARPETQEVLVFQEYTVNYGIAAAEFEFDWYTRLLKEMEETQ